MLNSSWLWLIARVLFLLIIVSLERALSLPISFLFCSWVLLQAYESWEWLGVAVLVSALLALTYALPFTLTTALVLSLSVLVKVSEIRLKSQTVRFTLATILGCLLLSWVVGYSWWWGSILGQTLSLVVVVGVYRAYGQYQLAASQRLRLSNRLRRVGNGL